MDIFVKCDQVITSHKVNHLTQLMIIFMDFYIEYHTNMQMY